MIVLYVFVAIIIGWTISLVFNRISGHLYQEIKEAAENDNGASMTSNTFLLLCFGSLIWLLMGIGVFKFIDFFR